MAIHAFVIATAIVISARSFEEPPDPPPPVIYRVELASPAAPGDSGGASAPRRGTAGSSHLLFRKAFPPAAFSAPAVVDSMGSGEPAIPGEETGDEGVGGGNRGVEGGTGTGTEPTGLVEEAAIPITPEVVAPQLTLRVEPAYPEAARRPRIQGLVILEAIITADGRVEDVRVLRSPSPLLSDSAVAAVSRWRYLPATLNGRPVKVFLTVTVDFKLH